MKSFFCRGIEYLLIIEDTKELTNKDIKHLGLEIVYIKNKRCIPIITQDQTDERLLKTNYFLKREENWYTKKVLNKLNLKTIEDLNITANEKNYICSILTNPLFEDYLIDGGWFDINYINAEYEYSE